MVLHTAPYLLTHEHTLLINAFFLGLRCLARSSGTTRTGIATC